jgi:rRNA maturation endonuclease Nob1
MALIQFTRNYRDDSTDRGFQFEFFCTKCGKESQAGVKFCPECGAKQG